MKYFILFGLHSLLFVSCGKSLPTSICECTELHLKQIKENGGMIESDEAKEKFSSKYKEEQEACQKINNEISFEEMLKQLNDCPAQKALEKMMKD